MHPSTPHKNRRDCERDSRRGCERDFGRDLRRGMKRDGECDCGRGGRRGAHHQGRRRACAWHPASPGSGPSDAGTDRAWCHPPAPSKPPWIPQPERARCRTGAIPQPHQSQQNQGFQRRTAHGVAHAKPRWCRKFRCADKGLGASVGRPFYLAMIPKPHPRAPPALFRASASHGPYHSAPDSQPYQRAPKCAVGSTPGTTLEAKSVHQDSGNIAAPDAIPRAKTSARTLHRRRLRRRFRRKNRVDDMPCR